MKYRYLCFIIILFVCSCKEQDPLSLRGLTTSAAREAYNKELGHFNAKNSYGLVDSLPTSLNWDECYRREISGESCLIIDIHPEDNKGVKEYNNKYSTKIDRYLLFRKDIAGQVKFDVVTFFKNSDTNNGLSVLVFDSHGGLLHSFVSDGTTLFSTNLDVIQNEKSLNRSGGNVTCIETDWYTCFLFKGVSYGCTYNYTTRQCIDIPDVGGGYVGNPFSSLTGSGNFDYNSVPAIRFKSWVVAPPSGRLISDIKKYFGCFTINSSSSYDVTLYVKQPIPNSRIIVSDGYGNKIPSSLDLNSLTVGHSFLGFSQGAGSSTAIRRYVGFYPSGMVSPLLPETSGVIADNSNTDYDVSVTFKVSAAEFKAIMDQFQAITKGSYNLNWNNCTDICLYALNIIGLKLPKTIGTWPLGSGANPADLGEDLRNFNSTYIKQKNLTGGTSPSNSAPCK